MIYLYGPLHRNQIEAFKEVAEQGTLEEFWENPDQAHLCLCLTLSYIKAFRAS